MLERLASCSRPRRSTQGECGTQLSQSRYVPLRISGKGALISTSQLPFSLIDISYTKAPTWIKVIPHYEHDQHAYFWAIATLGFPEARQENLQPPRESPSHHVLLPPDEQLLCYDYLYYVCAHQVRPIFFLFVMLKLLIHNRPVPQLSHTNLSSTTAQPGDL